jgi:membrane associated rhomboid family serine protease
VSSEAVTLVVRVALVLFLIVAVALFGTRVRPGKKRGQVILAGSLGGILVGLVVGYLISPWLKFDGSSICASLGMVLGGGVGWLFARQVPVEPS